MANTTQPTTSLLPNAPKNAPAASSWAKVAARWNGWRDGATTAPDTDGHHSFTRILTARVDRVEADIHIALVAAVEQIDRQITQAETEIRLLSAQATHSAAPAPAPADHDIPNTPQAQDQLRRQEAAAAATSAATTAAKERLKALTAETAALSERRQHVHTTAIGVLETWQAHCQELIGVHRGSYTRTITRRFPRPRITVENLQNLPHPQHQPKHDWARGKQLPMTITEIHPEQQPTLRWTHLPWNL